ncbi:hypothetical protein K469DRAFT_690009 [Zopfia rhizophila CBS 207.26]|uniref:Uncharacterized protein n=1 Tax=Zopfia rhizophila CBS 207.26 TaxID=1314779 RepID=A0A6A6E031_9PEZI|nr:hypothetical protein K469DRAFT_690009 [Zopfia rhizophila CBS 207.26]
MRLSIANVLLLNSLASGLRIPIPRPPTAPRPPTLPGGPDVPLPGQNQPGRWIPGQNTPNAPAAQPGRLLPEEQPKPACNGKKRMECLADPAKWDQLGVETKFRTKGAEEISRLDKIKENPTDANPNKIEETAFTEKYTVNKERDVPFSTRIGERLLGHKADDKWSRIVVKNNPGKVDELMNKMREQGITKVGRFPLRNVEQGYKEAALLSTYQNTDRKSIVIDFSFNNKYDVFRNYKTTEGNKFNRVGLDEAQQIRMTDQVMLGWRQAAGTANKDVKDVELEFVIQKQIVTDDTNNVINAALERVGKKLDDIDNQGADQDFFKFNKNDLDLKVKEGFEAIAGTVHGQRVAQMLRDYHDILGDRTITGFWVRKADVDSAETVDLEIDMVIKIEKIPDPLPT